MNYNEDEGCIKWSDLSAEEKERFCNETEFALAVMNDYLKMMCRNQGYLTYGDFLEGAGLWENNARQDPLRKKYFDWPYIWRW